MSSKAVTTKKQTLPTTTGDFEEYAGAGLETVTANDILIPRLTILEGLSPQLKKNKEEYIEGATAGMIADVGTGEIFPDGVLFLPVLFKKEYLEWAPRATGKGLVNIHKDPSILDQCQRDEKNKPFLANGNLIAETAQYYGLNLSARRRKSFVPMASSRLKAARRWNTLSTGELLTRADGTEYQAPLFYRTYRLGTAEASNAEGDWFNWAIYRGPTLPEIGPDLSDTWEKENKLDWDAIRNLGVSWQEIKREATEFYATLVAGSARGDVSDMGGDNDPATEEAM